MKVVNGNKIDNEEMEESGIEKHYSRNLLKNGDFEEADLSDWNLSNSNLHLREGGTTEGGNQCLKIHAGTGGASSAKQSINIQPQPPAILYGAMILPKDDIFYDSFKNHEEVEVKGKLQVTVKYIDSTVDTFEVPIRKDGFTGKESSVMDDVEQ